MIKRFFLFIILTTFVPIMPIAAETSIDGHPPNVLKSASELNYPPFALVREQGQADGFSVDLLNAVTHAVGLKVAIKVAPWHQIKRELINGKLDVLPLVSYSAERDRQLDFTVPYLRMHGAIFTRKDNTSIKNEADLKGKAVIVMKEDIAHEYAAGKKLTDRLILTDSYEEAFRHLSDGKHDAVLSLQLVGLQLIKKLGISNVKSINFVRETDLKPIDDRLTGFEQKFCMAVKEGDKKLLALLNEGLAIVNTKGVYDELYRKWFEPVLPQPEISWYQLARYMLLILVPSLIFISLIGIWYLNKQVAIKTTHLQNEIQTREKTEQVLSTKKKQLDLALRAAVMGIWDWEIATGRVEWAGEHARLFGISLEEFGGTIDDVQACVHPDDREQGMEIFQKTVREGADFDNTYRVVWPDDSVHWMHSYGKLIYDDNEEPVRIIGTTSDITERKEAEEKLKNMEAFQRTLLDTIPIPVFYKDRKGRYTGFNRAFEQFIGKSKEEMTGKSVFDISPPELADIYHEKDLALFKSRKDQRYESRIKKSDGQLRDVIFSKAVLTDAENNVIGLVGGIQDITEIKKAEKQVHSSLKEKKILLQELYHRTKNNMQTIVAMINMQTLCIEDEYILRIFEETKNRINAMALVHEKLYQSENLSRIDLQAYFTDLVYLLAESYPGLSGRVEISTDMETVYVPIDTAIPCGLIMNELISNAFQHAFPDDRHGEIQVSLKRLDSGEVILAFSDNGVGLPDGIDIENAESMGLKTIVALAEHQLSGKIWVSKNSGTCFNFTFKAQQ